MKKNLNMLIGILLLILCIFTYGFDFVGVYVLLVVANMYLRDHIGNLLEWMI